MAERQHFKMEGFAELERTLAELAKQSTTSARGVVRQSLTAAAKPIVRAMRKETG